MISEKKRVVVAVSDEHARTALIDNLHADGYEPLAALTLAHGRARLADRVDAVVLDLGEDTLTLIDLIRSGAVGQDAWVPILAGTTSEDVFFPVRLLERGADDVVNEAWFYFEVRARLASLLRRAGVAHTRQVFRAGSLRVDAAARRVWMGEDEIKLTAREFDLLRVLVSEPDRVFTRTELLQSVWGLGDWARTRTLDSHASRLRHRLNSVSGDWVRNVWGVGYRLTDTGVAPV